eukprot:3604468-Rhodomonas_salina.2
MPCTNIAYAPRRCIHYAVAGTDSAYAPTRRYLVGNGLRREEVCTKGMRPIGLRACYAMPGTAVACDGTDTARAYAAIREGREYGGRGGEVSFAISLRACYAMPGTVIAYGATIFPVLT